MTRTTGTLGSAGAAATRWRRWRWVLVGALAVACAGLLTEFATGVPGPVVPPGPIILGGTALIVGAAWWRWIPVLGLAVAGFLTVGAVTSGTLPRLATPVPVGPFVGTWVQFLAQLVAIGAALAALIVAARARARADSAA